MRLQSLQDQLQTERYYVLGFTILIGLSCLMLLLTVGCGLGAPGDYVILADPEISLSSSSAEEGGVVHFSVVLSRINWRDTLVKYSTEDGSGLAGIDYLSQTGQVIIPKGQISADIPISTIEDSLDEDDKIFNLRIVSTENAWVKDSVVEGRIIDNDPEPRLLVADFHLLEGTRSVFRLALSEVSGRDVKVELATLASQAMVGFDFTTIPTSIVIPAGTGDQGVEVSAIEDYLLEGDEEIRLQITQLTNAQLAQSTFKGVIQDNDSCGTIQLAQYQEGAGATKAFGFSRLSPTQYYLVGAHESSGVMQWNSWESLDGGAAWTLIDDFSLDKKQESIAHAVSKDALGNLYVAGFAGDKKAGNNFNTWVVRQRDNQGRWRTVDMYNLAAGESAQAQDVSVDGSGQIWVAGAAKSQNYERWVVRKSLDSGGTWSTQDEFQLGVNQPARAYSIHQASSGAIFAVGEAEESGIPNWLVRRSLDNGVTWTTVNKSQTPGHAKAVGSDRNGIVYVAGSRDQGEVWTVMKSLDNGATWTVVDRYLPMEQAASRANSLFIDRAGTIVVVGEVLGGGSRHWIARQSKDQGLSWFDIDNFQIAPGLDATSTHVFGDGYSEFYFTGYGVDAQNVDNLLMRSRACP